MVKCGGSKVMEEYKKPTLIKRLEKYTQYRDRYGIFECGICQKEFETLIKSVNDGNTKSCGCLRTKRNKEKSTHGMYNTREYRSWQKIKARCFNTQCFEYKWYGGRGITMCDEWKNSFEQFYKDMGPRPPKKSIERKDNNLNYNKDNCKWATQKEQSNNTRRNKFLTHNGMTKTLSEWADFTGINKSTISRRIELSWSTKEILETPVNTKFSVNKKNGN